MVDVNGATAGSNGLERGEQQEALSAAQSTVRDVTRTDPSERRAQPVIVTRS